LRDDCDKDKKKGDGDTYGSLPDTSPLYAALEEEQSKTPVAPVSGILTLTTLTLGMAVWTYYDRKRG
jgi:hypothetical protein